MRASDAQTNSTGDFDRSRRAILWRQVVSDAHPEMVLRDSSRRAIGRLMTPWSNVEKLLELFSSGLGFVWGVAEGQGMITGREQVIEPLWIGPDQFQLAINEWSRINKLETPEKQSGCGSAFMIAANR
jgi:hypothetical protein